MLKVKQFTVGSGENKEVPSGQKLRLQSFLSSRQSGEHREDSVMDA